MAHFSSLQGFAGQGLPKLGVAWLCFTTVEGSFFPELVLKCSAFCRFVLETWKSKSKADQMGVKKMLKSYNLKTLLPGFVTQCSWGLYNILNKQVYAFNFQAKVSFQYYWLYLGILLTLMFLARTRPWCLIITVHFHFHLSRSLLHY